MGGHGIPRRLHPTADSLSSWNFSGESLVLLENYALKKMISSSDIVVSEGTWSKTLSLKRDGTYVF